MIRLLAALLLVAAPALADGGLSFVPAPGAEDLAHTLSIHGVEDRLAVAEELGKDWDGVTEVRVAVDEASFRKLLPEGANLPSWAQGVAFPDLNLVVVRARPGDADPRATLRHELSHVAMGRLAERRVPRWFLEGLATIQAGDSWSRHGPSLVRAGLTGGLFSFANLDESFPSRPADAELAYAQSADFVLFVVDHAGMDAVRDVLKKMIAGEHFEDAFIDAVGMSQRTLEHEWRRSLAGWELGFLFLTNPGLWWGLVTLLFLYVWASVRRSRKLRLVAIAAEEEALAARELETMDAYWIDPPPTPADPPALEAAPGDAAPSAQPVQPEAAPDADPAGPSAEPSTGADVESDDVLDEDDVPDDEDPFADAHAVDPGPKKPTIH